MQSRDFVYLIKEPEKTTEIFEIKKRTVVDTRSLLERILNINTDKINLKNKSITYSGKVMPIKVILKFDRPVVLNRKIDDALLVDNFIFHGVIPMDNLPDGTTICCCDYYERTPLIRMT